jgi:hypothetical protein
MSVIKNGVFIKDAKPEAAKSSPGFKSWSHTDQRNAHRKDILQRYQHGKISGEWVRAYPTEAAEQFTPEQIRKAGNDYIG